MRPLVLIALSAAIGAAQVCGPSPEITAGIQAVAKLPAAERLNAARAFRDKYPDNVWAQRTYMGFVPDRDPLIAEYEKALAEHPGEASYLYYRGVSLTGIRTPDAIRYLNQAVEKDPGMALAHAHLAQIFGSPNFENATAMRSHLEAFLKACPEPVHYGNALLFYRALWALEMKAHPESEYPQIRDRIRKDLERLRNVGITDRPQYLATVRDARKLLGDPEQGDESSFLNRTLAMIQDSPDAASTMVDGEEVARADPEPVRVETQGPIAAIDRPLPDFRLKDITGKTWLLADIHGKTTLITVWATWCPPCRKELPYLQKLYERVKDRTDLQIVTLNVDKDEDLVNPFLAKNHYTFPVLVGHEYAHSVVTRLSIPRSWMIDKEGVLRSSTTGFASSRGKDWVDRTLKSLEKVEKGQYGQGEQAGALEYGKRPR